MILCIPDPEERASLLGAIVAPVVVGDGADGVIIGDARAVPAGDDLVKIDFLRESDLLCGVD